MRTLTMRVLIIAGAIALACGILSGCSAKENPPVKKTQQAAGRVAAEVRTVQKAKSLKVAFDNPKMGYCPVCGEAVNYESFVTIGRKHYALCSDACGEKLQNDPDQYLAAAHP